MIIELCDYRVSLYFLFQITLRVSTACRLPSILQRPVVVALEDFTKPLLVSIMKKKDRKPSQSYVRCRLHRPHSLKTRQPFQTLVGNVQPLQSPCSTQGVLLFVAILKTGPELK